MEKLEKLLDPVGYKERKLKEYENEILFGDITFMNMKQRKKNYPKDFKKYEDDLFYKITDIYNKQVQKNENVYNRLNFNEFSKYYETPKSLWRFWNFGVKEETKKNFEYNSSKLVKEYKENIGEFLSDIPYSLDKLNEKEEIKKTIKGQTKPVQIIKEKYQMIKGTGKCLLISLYCISVLIPLIILYCFIKGAKSYREKYESISFIDGEFLNKIKKNKDIKDLLKEKETLDNLSLSFFKFASLVYKKRDKKKEDIFPEPFYNWEIINYKLLVENDNYFYVLKNDNYKQLIFAFPETISTIQLVEEMLGSSLKNFHINNNNILISTYFGERIYELIDYIFTPEVNELIKKDYKVISTGYSLGGAIAQAFIYFSYVDNKISKNNFPTTITFNQPKVGNEFFSKFLDENACNLRVIKENDIVSDIPFSNFGFIDICKYIIGIRNSLNEYTHTEYFLIITGGKSLPPFLQKLIIIIQIFSLLYLVFQVYPILDYLVISNEFYGVLKFLVGVVFFATGLLIAFILRYIWKLSWKYSAFK